MIRSLLTTLALGLAFISAQAQTPQVSYAPAVANPSSGAFVFGNTLARHNQTLYPQGYFTGSPGTINVLYFRYGSNTGNPGNNTLDSVVISLGQTDIDQLPSINFRNGFIDDAQLTPVVVMNQLSIPTGADGQWFAIPTTQTFSFDPSRSLILDIKFKNSANLVFGARSTIVIGPRLRVYADNFNDTTGSSSSSLVPHFGFDFVTAVQPSLSSLGIIAGPSPAPGSIRLEVPAGLIGKEFTVTDAAGRCVSRGILEGQTRVAVPAKGLYMVQTLGRSQKVLVE